jgi:hypothetical protein
MLQASSATKQGGEKDARLQYLSWRIWHMRRRLAAVEQDQRGAEEESALTEDTAYTSDEEEQELTKAMSRGSLELRKLQRNKSKSRDQSPAGSEGRGKSGAAEVSFAKGGPASASGGVEGAHKSKLKVKVVGHTDAALETGVCQASEAYSIGCQLRHPGCWGSDATVSTHVCNQLMTSPWLCPPPLSPLTAPPCSV